MKIRSLVKVALFAALTAVSVYLIPPIAIPGIAVVFTLQTLFVLIAGYLLKPGEAFAAMAAYVALGAIGLPVFSGGQGGLPAILGPTGGFIVLFPVVALTIAILKKKRKSALSRIAIGILVGILGLYLPAVAWLTLFLQTDYFVTLLAMAPYALFDVVKVVIAEFIARKAERALTANGTE
ncbi:MAG: biotin transporter BioY [bacterium]